MSHVPNIISEIQTLFKLQTDSLLCPHNALQNLEMVENPHSIQTLTRFQAASHLTNALFFATTWIMST